MSRRGQQCPYFKQSMLISFCMLPAPQASCSGALPATFFALRRWLFITAILFVLAGGGVWVFGNPVGSLVPLLVVGLARGGLICLPLILMAELLPTRHFAKLAFLVQFLGVFSGGISMSLLLPALGEAIPLISWALVIEAIALAVVATFLRRPPRSQTTGLEG